MTRCRACNKQLSDIEMRLRKPDGFPEDLCNRCKQISRQSIHLGDLYDRPDYVVRGNHEDIDENN